MLKTNKGVIPCRRVLMLQNSPYRNLAWIPTTKVPMPVDNKKKND